MSSSTKTSSAHGGRVVERDERDRNEFVASFKLSISTASSPVLVQNDIRKLDNSRYSARIIKEYFQNSNPHNVNLHIKQIWEVHNGGHIAQFMRNNYDKVDNMLLWHGTTRNNLVSILQNSLKLPVAATNGHMFGPGIYFADRMSKSANYTDKSGPEVFLLCQVALGKKWRVYKSQNFTSAPSGFDTLKAVGKNVPDIRGQKKFGTHCKIPCGKTVPHHDSSIRSTLSLDYNEYVVFNQDRIIIKFIVQCERSNSNSSSYVTPAIVRTVPTVINAVPRPLASTSNQTNTVSLTRPSTVRLIRKVRFGPGGRWVKFEFEITRSPNDQTYTAQRTQISTNVQNFKQLLYTV